MSQGKYSPRCPHAKDNAYVYNRNCHGQEITDRTMGLNTRYDDKLHFPNYDDEGFDSYGYSAFNKDGKFVGHGLGVDRLGYTEEDYIFMEPEDFLDLR